MSEKMLSVSSHCSSENYSTFVTLNIPEAESQIHGYYRGLLYNAGTFHRKSRNDASLA